MMSRRTAWLSATAVFGLALGMSLAQPRPAQACGTMLFESHAERPGGMNAQELFVSLAPDATTMVIAASFIDATGDKAFLLPLAAAPDEVRDGDASLFFALETGTVPVVTIREDEPVGLACGPKAGGDANRLGEGNSEVEVLERGSTATYDYVVVGGDSGESLADWLNMAGFGVPAEFEAALDDYADAGWSFLAATLADNVDAGQLAPLELRLPAGATLATTIPFGVAGYALPPGESLDIVLYVASPSGPVLPQNYAVTTIDEDALVATSESTSNYAELFEDAIAAEPTWVVEYSRGEWSTGSLESWVYGDWELGIEGDEDVDPTYVNAFVERLGYEQARLTRLRTRLSAEDLKDLELDMAAAVDVDRHRYLTWDPNEGCGVAPTPVGGGLLGFGALGLLGLVRRRRSRTQS